MRTLQEQSRLHPDTLCAPCVYFSRNLDAVEYPVLMQSADRCGLGFLPGDNGCTEMRTDNCSAKKNRD